MNAEEELLKLLRSADAIIGYSPIDGEPDVHGFLKQNNIEGRGRSVVADKHVSPNDFARSVSESHVGEKVCVLIPGKEFDRTGTRHGRGGGWYDRFLSAIPREWARIGVLNESALREQALKREVWDEPVDFLLIKASTGWRVDVATKD